jgi:hypothetical protein
LKILEKNSTATINNSETRSRHDTGLYMMKKLLKANYKRKVMSNINSNNDNKSNPILLFEIQKQINLKMYFAISHESLYKNTFTPVIETN